MVILMFKASTAPARTFVRAERIIMLNMFIIYRKEAFLRLFLALKN